MTVMTEVWTAEQLMGGTVTIQPEGPPSKKSVKGMGVDNNPLLWGLPGHLTSAETETFFLFREQVERRGGDFRDTVFSFGEVEGEVWALCRWLRARKFVLEDVLKMVEEATETRKDAKSKNFYPNAVDALGVEASLFYAQYPQLYSGFAKNGVPLFISKPGILNVDGMECITTLDGIIKFHWHIMMHDFANRLRAQKEKDPDTFKRFECVCVLDLDKLTSSQLSKRALLIIKEQAAIDSICFPETMNKMLIINAPTFFAVSWKLIKGWLDPRTSAKIEVISSRATAEKKLLELVDADQLPCDYGGRGPDTNVTIMESLEADRMTTKMLYLRGCGSEIIEVHAGEKLQIEVFTRSTAGGVFSLSNADTKAPMSHNTTVKHSGTDDVTEKPSSGSITPNGPINGPCKVKITATSNAGRFSTQNFLFVFTFHKQI